jgi:hypothetical protein
LSEMDEPLRLVAREIGLTPQGLLRRVQRIEERSTERISGRDRRDRFFQNPH